MPIKSSRLCGTAFAAWYMLSVSAAGAQYPMLPNEAPGPFVREAFDAPYGRALVAELGKVLLAAADPACLQSNRIGHDQLLARGRELLIKGGTRIMETMPHVDKAKYALKFPLSAATELERLTKHSDVAPYIAVERPMRLVLVVGLAAEEFDRYVLHNKLKVHRLSAIDNNALQKVDPTDRIVKETAELAEKSTSAAVRRFVELSRLEDEAASTSLSGSNIYVGPGASFYGVEVELAELCITAQR